MKIIRRISSFIGKNRIMNTVETLSNDARFSNHSNIHLSTYIPHNGHANHIDHKDLNSIKSFALVHCREYLGGIWKTVDKKQFHVEKVSGGLSNYLYLCSIRGIEDSPRDDEPVKVLLRIYGENHHNNSSTTLKDIIVSAIMSDKRFGPKLYGIFPQGRLEQFIPSNSLVATDLPDEKTNASIGRLLAQFHSLEMPFIKEPRWLYDTIDRYMNKIDKGLNFKTEVENQKYKQLESYKFREELEVLKSILEKVESPVVFCHNDLQPGNVLRINNEKMFVIDYEYGAYNYRGFDLGNYFCEWMMNNNYEYFPYFAADKTLYPTKAQQLIFIRSYLKEYQAFTAKNKFNMENERLFDEEKVLIEANTYALASHFFWSIWSICQAAATQINFSYLDYGLTRMQLYFELKDRIQKGILFKE